jgi:hypothetical protein
MSVYTKSNVVEEFPAYVVVKRETVKGYYKDGKRVDFELTEIVDGDILGLKKHNRLGDYYKEYSPGSVVSYALQYNEDPIVAVEHAKAHGHKLHWINGCGVALTAHEQAQRTLVKVEIGMFVRFQGLVATIEEDFNDNLKFVPVKGL